jgi:hypothetical protein
MRLKLTTVIAVLTLTGCARLNYPEIGLHENVVTGGQAEINQGYVVRVDLPGIWLAGHRTDAGGVFRNLVFARPGDVVCVYSTCWHVVRVMVVPHSYHPPAEGLGPLVLQTSWPGDRDLLVICG